jgi:hypothetical protein
MLKRIVVGGSMIAASAALATVGIWYVNEHGPNAATVRPGGSAITLNESKGTSTTAIDTSSPRPTPTNGLRVVSPSSESQLGIGDTPTSSGGSSASLPGPESFGQYEQYKNNTSSLFGEIRIGDGTAAEAGKTVVVHYRGWLTNGQQFDESYARGKPYSFVIGEHRVILGWEEAIMGMKVGGKRRFIIPPAVGYGAQEQNGIPANSLLVFDVELLAVQ